MIRKCNTSAKYQTTPYHQIRVSQFSPSQEHCPEYQQQSSMPAAELEYNITKIKECKQQTNQFITDISNQLTHQDLVVRQLRQMYEKQRQKSKLFRAKYHEAHLKLRQKDEDYQSLEKRYNIQQQNFKFMKTTSEQNVNELLQKQQEYWLKIHTLEHQLEQLQNRGHPISIASNSDSSTLSAETTKFNNQSTFI